MGADHGNPSVPGELVGWRCPACRELLDGRANLIRCTDCGAVFPRLGRLPLLISDARTELCVAAAALGARRHALSEEIAALDPERIDPRLRFRAAVLARRREGLRRNLALVEEGIGAALESIVRSGGPVVCPAVLPGGESLGNWDTGLLFTDWGKEAAGEKEVSRILDLARELAGPLPTAGGARALFLGAGIGRHAAEMARGFGATWAIDLSIDRMWLFDQVLKRPLAIAAFEDDAPLNSRQLTRFAQTEPPPPVPGLHLAVADARHIPLASQSITHVFSVYFTDLLPLPDFLPEVARVLVPGGSVVHVGPLHYAFRNAAWRLAPDEFPQAFRQFGFTIEQLRDEPLEWGQSNSSGLSLHYRGLAFRARKDG